MAARHDTVALTSSVLFAAAPMGKVDNHARTLLIFKVLCVACIHDFTILSSTINSGTLRSLIGKQALVSNKTAS